jgi:hypothetical protein
LYVHCRGRSEWYSSTEGWAFSGASKKREAFTCPTFARRHNRRHTFCILHSLHAFYQRLRIVTGRVINDVLISDARAPVISYLSAFDKWPLMALQLAARLFLISCLRLDEMRIDFANVSAADMQQGSGARFHFCRESAAARGWNLSLGARRLQIARLSCFHYRTDALTEWILLMMRLINIRTDETDVSFCSFEA